MSDARGTNGFLRKSLPQLVEMAQTDIEANLPGAVARLPQTNLDALAHMAAGAADEQLEGLDYYAKQIHITTSDGWSLERHGAEWGVLRREPTRATGTISIAITVPTVVPRGSVFQTIQRVRLRTTALLDTGTAVGSFPVAVEAIDTGPEGNLASGTRLDTLSPVVGVALAIVATPGLAGGTPGETQEEYRARILQRIQNPPMGGAAYDYIAWMLQFPGCTRAWVFPLEQGIGTVICRFTMDDTYPDGVPPAEEVARMAQWLDARRPVTAEVFVYAPIPRAIDVTVRDLNWPNGGTQPPVQVRQAVEDELRDMLYRNGAPGSVVYRSWFWEAVSIASGERHHHIDVPADDIQLLIGEIGVLGDLTFTFSGVPRRR